MLVEGTVSQIFYLAPSSKMLLSDFNSRLMQLRVGYRKHMHLINDVIMIFFFINFINLMEILSLIPNFEILSCKNKNEYYLTFFLHMSHDRHGGFGRDSRYLHVIVYP